MSLTPFLFRNPSIVSFLRDVDDVWDDLDATGTAKKSRSLVPRMTCDVSESKDSLVIHADLPGVTKEQIDLNIDKQVLTIRAVREEKTETDKDAFHMRERGFGKVSRSFQLPTTVLLDSASCSFDNGVLTVSFKKNPALEPRKLQIQ
jgi:HSP20 family protein